MFTIRDARVFAEYSFLASPFLKKKEYEMNAARFDADVLIAHLLKKDRAWILSHSDFDFSNYKKKFERLVKKRTAGLPIAYLTGKKDFYGNTFYVNENVLIPKPDTETLVDCAFDFAKDYFDKNKSLFVLDICTGSGCIGISLASELYSYYKERLADDSFLEKKLNSFFKENFFLMFADISEKALDVCKKNIKDILPNQIQENTLAVKADLRVSLPDIPNLNYGLYNLITANPPYVPSSLTDELLKDGRSEPHLALDGGADGLNLIPFLAEKSYQALSVNGKLFVEVGEYHAVKASSIFSSAGFSSVKILKDLAGKDRVIECTKN